MDVVWIGFAVIFLAGSAWLAAAAGRLRNEE